MEVCTTLGMLTPEQAKQLREAGLTAYNHNLDTSPGVPGIQTGDSALRGSWGWGWQQVLGSSASPLHLRLAPSSRGAPAYTATSLLHPGPACRRVLPKGDQQPQVRGPTGDPGERAAGGHQRVCWRHHWVGGGAAGPGWPAAPGGWLLVFHQEEEEEEGSGQLACQLPNAVYNLKLSIFCLFNLWGEWLKCWRCGSSGSSGTLASRRGIFGGRRQLCWLLRLPLQLATLPAHPESVPINALVAVKGTPMEDNEAPSGGLPGRE